MKQYTLLEHTTDIRLKLEASTLPELFTVALEGMSALIKKKVSGNALVSEEIALQATDVTALLIDFLSEVVTKSHIKKTVYTQVIFSELTETTLNAIVSGSVVDFFDEDIKAVTYHEAYVTHNEKGIFEAQVIFDI